MAATPTVVEVVTSDGPRQLHDETVRTAMRKLWDGDVSGAAALVEPNIKRLPRHALVYAETHWLRSLLLGQKPATDRALELFSAVRKLTEDFISKHPRRALDAGLLYEHFSASEAADVMDELQLVFADANLLSGILHMKNDSFVKGAWRFRTAWSIYSALYHRAKPATAELLPSVQFGTGLFLFIVSWMPPAVTTLMSLIGFECNRKLGLELLGIAAAHPDSIRAANASFISLANLLLIPRALADVNSMLAMAKPILERAQERWPNGPMWQWMYSFYERKTGNAEKAIEHMNKAIATVESMTGSVAPTMLEIDRACCFLASQRWSDAAAVCARLCENISDKHEFVCMPRVIHAMCVQMEGDREKAFALLRSCPQDAKGKDKIWLGLGARCLQRKSGLAIFPFELLYLRRDLAHMRPENIRPLIAKLETSFQPVRAEVGAEELGVYHLVHGAMLRIAGDVDSGVAELQQAATTSIAGGGFKAEKHVAAFAHCELAEIAYQNGNIAETERLLAIAVNHNGGLLDDLIRPRMRIALDQIRTEKAERSHAASSGSN